MPTASPPSSTLPRQKPALERFTHTCQGVGRLCGSKIAIQFQVDPQTDRIVDYSYQTNIGSLGFLACTLLFEHLKKPTTLSDLRAIAHTATQWLECQCETPPPPPFNKLEDLRTYRDKREQVLTLFHCLDTIVPARA